MTGLTEQEMATRFYARDRKANGLFYTAVLSTGIYCLPSCVAKKPLRENLRFFRDAPEARRGGFRACLRCRPDEWAKGLDVDTERVRRIIDAVLSDSRSFSNVDAMARVAGVKRSRLAELFRVHLQESPAAWLRTKRIEAAAVAMTRSSRPIFEIALDHDFASSSTFHSAFLRTFGITPMELRRADGAIDFHLPSHFRTDLFLRSIAADPNHPSERADSDSFRIAARSEGETFVLDGRFRDGVLRVTSGSSKPLPMLGAVRFLSRRLGLLHDPRIFERTAGEDFRRMISVRSGLRTGVLSSPFDALFWAIAGQAITRTFASRLRRSIVELTGEPAGGALYIPPRAGRILQLGESALVATGLTRAKASTILSVAEAVNSGTLDLEGMRSVEEIRERLHRMKGIGTWTVEYVLMRGYGFADVVPLGDAGLRGAVSKWKSDGEPVNDKDVERAVEPFRGQRSLAVEHLWHWNDEQKGKR